MRSRLTFFAVAITLLISSGQTARSLPPRTLSLAERVVYQYKIEEVYWHNRIWPKENRGPKPLLDEVMSRADVERKVEDYLRNSQLLADQQRPITESDLQAEMDHMASHTKQPDVLRELFAALGNDPFAIAECLARAALVERLLTNICAHKKELLDPPRIGAENDWPSVTAPAADSYTLPTISDGATCIDDSWTATSTVNAPTGRLFHTAVWTGSEMIVWGGGTNITWFNTGGRYNPSTDTWAPTSITNAPTARGNHTVVWTGSEMIVWGGPDNTGGRYNPTTNSWTATSTINAPTGRLDHTAVWTGSEMIVWGGEGDSGYSNTGGRYNPTTNSWTATSTTNAPDPRGAHTAVWTGTQMIVWGGSRAFDFFNTGGRYNPTTNTWTATNISDAPSIRDEHTAVWTGTEMIVWGGNYFGTYFNDGGKYNPDTNGWVGTSTINAPTGRLNHTAVWTGSEMIIWGGSANGTGNPLNTGGKYDPGTNLWIATSVTNAPDARFVHTAVWTGNEMIVWGGDNGNVAFFNTGGRYCAQPSAPIVQSTVSRKTHGGAGSFDVNLPASGTPGIECRSGGATNDHTVVVTFLANVSVNGNPQAAVTAGTGTVGSGGVGNGGMVTISGNVVTIPLTNIANAQTINVTLNSVNGSTNVVIPMGILIGDTNANGTVNAADVAQTKSRLGQTVDVTNFRSDVNANGSINAADTAIVKQNSGTSLPP